MNLFNCFFVVIFFRRHVDVISVCLFLFLEIYISKLSLFVSIVILNFCQYWHLYIMDYKVMLTNKYLREINAKFYLCKKNERWQ